jgi:hypothetical protein
MTSSILNLLGSTLFLPLAIVYLIAMLVGVGILAGRADIDRPRDLH